MTTISPTARRGMSATWIEGPLVLVRYVAFDRWRISLRVVGRGCLEGERVHWIAQVSFITAHRAEVVADLDPLVGAHVHIDLRTVSQEQVKILGQHDAAAGFAVVGQKAVKSLRRDGMRPRAFPRYGIAISPGIMGSQLNSTRATAILPRVSTCAPGPVQNKVGPWPSASTADRQIVRTGLRSTSSRTIWYCCPVW